MEDDVEGFDQARADAFQSKMFDVLNGGALALLCSVGRQTDLFDSMDGLGPATSEEIAAAAGLQERYVREWLAAMACGGIVDYDPGSETFMLPAEHARSLTKAAGGSAVTFSCQFIAELGTVEQDIVEVFRSGGGVGYERYPRFTELMAESSGNLFRDGLLEHVVPVLPGGTSRLAAGVDLVDVGCGSGRAVNMLASQFPASRFWGYDFSETAIATARADAAAAGNTNAVFEVRDAAALDLAACFDIATSFDAVHDQADPGAMLSGIFDALRPGGTYLCAEPKASSDLQHNLEHPTGPFLYGLSTMHCLTVSLASGGEGLGAAWGEEHTRERLTDAGFSDISVSGLPHDRVNHYFLSHKPI